jgi:hypothetical protein
LSYPADFSGDDELKRPCFLVFRAGSICDFGLRSVLSTVVSFLEPGFLFVNKKETAGSFSRVYAYRHGHGSVQISCRDDRKGSPARRGRGSFLLTIWKQAVYYVITEPAALERSVSMEERSSSVDPGFFGAL